MLFDGGGAPPRFRLWSLEEDAALRALANQGKGSAAIAAFLSERFSRHFSQSAVQGRCARIGVRLNGTPNNPHSHPRWSAEEDAALKEMAERGRSAKEIAVLLSTQFQRTFTRNAVIGRSHRLEVRLSGKSAGNPAGFNGRSHKFSEEENAELKVLIAERHSIKLIADIMGISHWAIRRQCNELGLIHLGHKGRWQQHERTEFSRAPREKRDPNNRGPSKKCELPVEGSKHATTFFDLRDDQCRWPINGENNSLFCGARALKVGWGSYCSKHCSRAYQVPR